MEKNDYVVVLGAANIDIQGFSLNRLIMEDSNPGKVKISSGGVGRNIAENLAKLGVPVKLITVFGDDPYSKRMISECRENNIDVSHSLFLNNVSSPIYLSILDSNRDMKLAVCDNEILEKINIDFIKTKQDIIEKSQIVLLDTNLPLDILEYIATTYKHKKLFVDTVSTQKALKIKEFIGCFDTLKLNYLEAKALSDISADNYSDLSTLHDFFTNRGAKNVFITLGKDGVYYGNKNYKNKQNTPEINVVNATGAGDAFMAALIYSRLNNHDMDFTARFSIGASILALYHENTINPDMSFKNIYNLLEELKLC